MTLPLILRQPSTKIKNLNKKSDMSSLLFDPQNGESGLLPLRDIRIDQEFDILKTLHEGAFSKLLLARRRINSQQSNNERLVLKVIPHSSVEDFYRELNYNYFLSPHPSVVKCFNVPIVWSDSYIFPMEYAPWGNLSRFIPPSHLQEDQEQENNNSCLGEATVKLVAKQVASALDFIHSFKLVHRAILPENVLLFTQDCSQIKLCDFGATRPEKSLVVCLKHEESSKELFQLPPEICHLVRGESYYVHRSSDVWQLGMLIYLLLCGGVEPWQSADDISDPAFSEWVQYLRRKNLRVPEAFSIFSPRLLRLFKRVFEPKHKKRCDAREFLKYLDDDWILVSKLVRAGTQRSSSSFRRSVLERKTSTSTNRSRSSGTGGRSRNSSLKRKSFRNSTKSNSLRQSPIQGNNNVMILNNINNNNKESSLDPSETGVGGGGGRLSGSGRDKLSEVDRDFVKERVGQWILEAASSVNNYANSQQNMLTVPSV